LCHCLGFNPTYFRYYLHYNISMNKIYALSISSSFLILSNSIFAQCSSCTTSITGIDNNNYIITSGQTFCITSSGTCTGLITVSGGTLCNQGTITSSNIWVATSGSVFNNYGTINTSNVLVSNGAAFNNNGTAVIDSLWIVNPNSNYHNGAYAHMTNQRFAVSSSATGTNAGTITVDYMGDDSTATFTNSGNLSINYDFANAYNSTFQNTGYMKIMRDYYNSFSSNFSTSCMIDVGRDWYNSAIISVPTIVSCAGFNISGMSLNSGTIGNISQHVDICDAGHPSTGVDGNSGTIATTTTYCNCSNTCVLNTGINEVAKSDELTSVSVYPNPANDFLNIRLENNTSEQTTIEVIDIMGNKISEFQFKTACDSVLKKIDISTLPEGMYFLRVNNHNKMFNVVK
jgi:Secretion system C-terminal sorting domain